MGNNGEQRFECRLSLGKSGKSRKVGWTMQRSWFLSAAISKWHPEFSREFFSPFIAPAPFFLPSLLSFFLLPPAKDVPLPSPLAIASPAQPIFSAASFNGLSRGLIGNSFPRIFSSMKNLSLSLSVCLSVCFPALSSNVATLLHKIGEEGGKGEKEEDEEDDGAPLYKASERYGRAWLFALPVSFFPLWVSKVSGVSVTVSVLARSTPFLDDLHPTESVLLVLHRSGNIDDSKLWL